MSNSTVSRILYRGECQKLIQRGSGKLTYELGVDDKTDEAFIRIAGNAQGGTCSFEWIKLQTLEGVLVNRGEEEQIFSAVLFKEVFSSKSMNNHGFLAAILKAEKVIGTEPKQPTKLTYLSFGAINERVKQLKAEKVDLPDLIAAEQLSKKSQRQQSTDKTKKRGRPRKSKATT